MPAVVSLGSLNVDRIRLVSPDDLRTLEAETTWLPDRGETRRVPDLPDDALAAATDVALGGKGANQALAAAKAGASTGLLGAVGPDHENHGVLSSLRSAGVDVSHVSVSDEPTGTALILVEGDGENRIALREGANATVDKAYVRRHQDQLITADCVLIQNEIPLETTLEALAILETVDDPPLVILDPSPAAGAHPLVTAPPVDVITPNTEEAAQLDGALAVTDATVVNTAGPGPVHVRGGESMVVHPPRVTPVDATAAGDVFVGYLGAGLAVSELWDAAIERAVAAASLSTETGGAQPSIPDQDTVTRFLAENGPLDIHEI